MTSTAAALLMDRLGLSEDELCRVLGVDPLAVISGDLDDKPQLPILLALTGEAAERVGEDVLRRWVRATGPSGRPLDHLLEADFAAFEDDLAVLAERGLVVRGGGGAPGGGAQDARATPGAVTGRRGDIRIRRVTAGEAEVLREVRLRALTDTPLAFGSTHAREAAYPPERWAAWASESANGRRQATFLAVAERDAVVGLAFTVVDADDDTVAHLFSMWVAAEARRSGAGGALVDAVIGWATVAGAERVRTAVTVGNDAAARLYARRGFRETGVREPLGHSDAEMIVLERPLGP